MEKQVNITLNKVFTITKGNRVCRWKVIVHPYNSKAYALVRDHPYLRSGVALPADVDYVVAGVVCPLNDMYRVAYDAT